jgi:uncharacterized protein
MRALALAAIRFYQRFMSPLKGYACAYRVYTGACSCSTLGYRAIRRYGLIGGGHVLRERMFLCGVANRRYGPRTSFIPAAQRGECDIGCDAPFDPECNMPSTRCLGHACDAVSCCDVGSCDGPQRRRSETRPGRKRRGPEREVHLPHRWR